MPPDREPPPASCRRFSLHFVMFSILYQLRPDAPGGDGHSLEDGPMISLACLLLFHGGVFCFARFQRLDRLPEPTPRQQTTMLVWGFVAGVCGTAVLTLLLQNHVVMLGDFMPERWAMILQCAPMLYMLVRYAEMRTYHAPTQAVAPARDTADEPEVAAR